MEQLHVAARRAIEDARATAAEHYDQRHRAAPDLAVGDRVMVRTSILGRSVRDNWALRKSASSLPRFTGAFEVIGPTFSNTVTIAFPASIDPTSTKRVNVNNIKLATMQTPLYAPGPVSFDEDGQPLYEVDHIVADDILDGHAHTSLYVKYKGYNIPEWTPIDNLRHLHILLNNYFAAVRRPTPAK